MSELKNNYVTANFDQDNNMNGGLGNVYELTPSIAQGPGLNQRIGNTIRYKNLQLRMYISSNKPWTITASPLRIIIFKPRIDMDTTNIANVASLVFMEPTGVNNQYLNSFDYNNCWVLMDRMFNFGGTGLYDQTGAKNQYFIKKNFRVHNKVQYKTNGAVVQADIKDRYFMYIIPPYGTALTSSWSVEYISRLTYRDA